MPILSNAKHEKFCLAVVAGKTKPEAYVAAGYSHNKGNASTLASKAHIKSRIAELKGVVEQEAIQQAALSAAISKAWVLDCLRANALKGLAEKTASSVANRSLELIGREIGMFVERHEQGKPGDFAHLSDEELDAQLTQRLKARGLTDKQIRGFLVLGGHRDDGSQGHA